MQRHIVYVETAAMYSIIILICKSADRVLLAVLQYFKWYYHRAVCVSPRFCVTMGVRGCILLVRLKYNYWGNPLMHWKSLKTVSQSTHWKVC